MAGQAHGGLLRQSKSEGHSKMIRKDRLVIDAYFSETKIKWILENVDELPGWHRKVKWLRKC
jgi:glycerol kinase